VRLAALLAAAGLEPCDPTGDPDVLRVVHDSREVTEGDLFCCISGGTHDGHGFAADAVAAGAIAVLAERSIVSLTAPTVIVPSVRATIGPLAAALHGWPSRAIDLFGVTGTNGKTSVVHLLRSILDSSGRHAGSWGTLSGERTTPEGTDLQATIAGWVDHGVEAAAIEVSSHALAQHRVDGTTFTAVGFTTLGRDHLDFHGSPAAYEAAKARLFEGGFSDHAIVNVGDAAGARMASVAEAAGLSVVRVDPAKTDADLTPTGCTLVWRGRTVRVATGGRFTVANALVAAELAMVLGCGEGEVAAGLAAATPVPGRFEPVPLPGGPTVIVDYAHTPDALSAVLGTAREVLDGQGDTHAAAPGRLLVVFGCGGDRDVGKRPLMGRAADEAADVAIVTSDNPRGEPPEGVIADILAGMERPDPLVEPDRRRAIAVALAAASPADLIVVAGRGHETSQEVAGRQLPFDDRMVVAEEWAQLVDSASGPGVDR
jgi:UDP-N-acetylmuramoyl-L-alanyl-D-glutamate--2,6-diaminopimelate ligase